MSLNEQAGKPVFPADEAQSTDDATPDLSLPHAAIEWTARELESLEELASTQHANPPTEAVIRAMRGYIGTSDTRDL